MLDNLPSIGQMLKLIVLLFLALIVVKIVTAIVALFIPLLIVAALIAGGVYLFNKLQTNGAAS
jgi:hypothetical protein